MSRYIGLIALVMVCLVPIVANGAAPGQTLPADQQDRYHALIQDLRCVVCQNRSIAESDAPLAGDLRRIVARQIEAGQTDAQIKTYLVDRYGDWILYDPPFIWSTVLLWVGPFLLLGLGLWLIVTLVRKRRAEESAAGRDMPDTRDRARLHALLNETDDPGSDR